MSKAVINRLASLIDVADNSLDNACRRLDLYKAKVYMNILTLIKKASDRLTMLLIERIRRIIGEDQ